VRSLAAGVQVSELCEPLRLDVVLALAGPVQHATTSCEAQQIVCAGAPATDEAEDLVREQAQLSA
jgi:hypothetical protein